MNLFYTPDIISGIYSLNEEESRHCRLVLRLRKGDIVHLTNGRGTLFEARILDSISKQVTVEVVSQQENFGKKNFRLHLAVAPTKNIDRFEWFVEKASEIGVDEITPLLCEHSERRQIRNDRLEKVATAAVKQSLKTYLPKINEIKTFQEFISASQQGSLFIAHLDEINPVQLKEIYKKGADATILVGPEGDFSDKEIQQATNADYDCIALGLSRLRTETAAVAACISIYLLND